MEKIFFELYKDIHSSVQPNEDPLKKFLFATRQHILIIFYISSQNMQKTTLENICNIKFFEKEVNLKDKREKFYKLSEQSIELMQEWAINQNSIFSKTKEIFKG